MSALASAVCFRPSLLSEMPCKGDHKANGEKNAGGVMAFTRVNQSNYDAEVKEVHTTTPAVATNLSWDRKKRREGLVEGTQSPQ